MANDTKWLIWSNEHESWWAPESRGYTTSFEKAGRYNFDQAIKICRGANYLLNAPGEVKGKIIPNEAMVPVTV